MCKIPGISLNFGIQTPEKAGIKGKKCICGNVGFPEYEK